MPEPQPPEPVEERLARRLGHRDVGAGAWSSRRAASLLRRLAGYDRAVYRSVAQMHAPLLDEPLRRVSDFANFSKPWFLIASVLALLGGPPGRRAAVTGLAAVGTASLVVNQPMKMAGERHRPDRVGLGVPHTDGCVCRRRRRSPPGTPRPLPPSPSPSEMSCLHSGCRYGRQRPSWPSPACTPACTTPVTSSSGRPRAPCWGGSCRGRGAASLGLPDAGGTAAVSRAASLSF